MRQDRLIPSMQSVPTPRPAGTSLGRVPFPDPSRIRGQGNRHRAQALQSPARGEDRYADGRQVKARAREIRRRLPFLPPASMRERIAAVEEDQRGSRGAQESSREVGGDAGEAGGHQEEQR